MKKCGLLPNHTETCAASRRLHIDLFCVFVAIKIFSVMLRCGHATKQRVTAKFISNETLESKTFVFNLNTGPSPGFRSKGSKTTRRATF